MPAGGLGRGTLAPREVVVFHRPSGKYFEELNIGDKFVSPGRTLTEADIVNFAAVSGDYNPLHTDEEFARRGVFGSRIAHGLLTLAIASGLISRTGILEGTTIAFLGSSQRFLAPVKPGDTLTLHTEVVNKKRALKPDRGIVTLKLTIVNQQATPVMESEWDLLLKRAGG